MLVVGLIVLLLILWSLLAAATDKFGGGKTAIIVTDVALILWIAFGSGIIRLS